MTVVNLISQPIVERGQPVRSKPRSPKGSVKVFVRGRLLCLQLPRLMFGGIQKVLPLGVPETPVNRKGAELKARQIEMDWLAGNLDVSLEKYKLVSYSPLIASTPADLSELWQRYSDVKKSAVSPTTLRNSYRVVASHLVRCPHKLLSDASKIQDWAVVNLTSDTARRLLMQLSACCRWAVKRNLCSDNPFAGMTSEIKKKRSKAIDPFNLEEQLAIVEAFERSQKFSAIAPAIKFLFWTGCRTGEMIGLQWRHVSPDCSEIEFSEVVVLAEGGSCRKLGTKNGTTRRFPCNARLQAFLLDIRPIDFSPGASIFPVSHQQLRTAWYGKGKQVGIVRQLALEGKIRRYRVQYNTRHTFCTECLERGISPAQISAWVGNSTEMILRHYSGVIKKVVVPEF